MLKIKHIMAAGLILFGLTAVNVNASPNVLGYIEYAYLQPWGFELKSKLDTGAKTSSIYAVNIESFEKDGEEWVSFTMPFHQDEEIEPIQIEKKVTRSVLIKRKHGESLRRYVVEFDICIDGIDITSEFTLANRKGFLYSVLLGRNTLKGNAVVDPGEVYLADDMCHSEEDS